MSDNTPVSRASLQRAGLRATAQRIAVLEVLRGTRGHLSAEAVTEAVRTRLGSVSQQAVYDVLSALATVGLARRIEPARGPARFESRIADNHHHVVCTHCGAIEDIDCVVGASPCLEPSEVHGYAVDETEITFWGLCPKCQAAVG